MPVENGPHLAVTVPREKYQSFFNDRLYQLYGSPSTSHEQIRIDFNVIRPTMQKTGARLYVQSIGFLQRVVRECSVEPLTKEEVMFILYDDWSDEEKSILQSYYTRCESSNPKRRANAYRETTGSWKLMVAVVRKMIAVYENRGGLPLEFGDLLNMVRTTEVKPIWTNRSKYNFKLICSKADKVFRTYQKECGYEGTKEFNRFVVTWNDDKDIDTSTISMERPVMEDKPPLVLPLPPPSPPPQPQEEKEPIYERRISNLKKMFRHCFPLVNIHAFFHDMNNTMCEKQCEKLLLLTDFDNYEDVLEILGLNDDEINPTKIGIFKDFQETIKNANTFYQLIEFMCYRLSQDDMQSDSAMAESDVPQQSQGMVVDEQPIGHDCSMDYSSFNSSVAGIVDTNLSSAMDVDDRMDSMMGQTPNFGSSFPQIDRTMNEPQAQVYGNYEGRLQGHENLETENRNLAFLNQSQWMENPNRGEPYSCVYNGFWSGPWLADGHGGDSVMQDKFSYVDGMSTSPLPRYGDPPPSNPHEQDWMEPPRRFYN